MKALLRYSLRGTILLLCGYLLFRFVGAEYYWHQGDVSYKQKFYAEAIQYYSKALDYGRPGFLSDLECLYCNRGDAYDLDGQTEKALADYTEAIRRSPRTARFYVEQAICYRRAKRYPEAIAALDQALALPKPKPRYYFERAAVRVASGAYDQAITDLDRYQQMAQQDKPGTSGRPYRALDLRGWSHYKLGHFPQALADFDAALQLKPDYAEALHDRGDAHKAMGHASQAEADYQRAHKAGYKE